MRKLFLSLAVLVAAASLNAQTRHTTTITSLPNERWWGVNAGAEFSDQPSGVTMLVSSAGRYIWNATPMKVQLGTQTMTITSDAEKLEPVKAGRTLREAYLVCFHKNVQSTETLAPTEIYTKTVYDLRLDAATNHNEAMVRQTADKILAAGLPAGTIIIPEDWQSSTLAGQFNNDLYPNPKALVQYLHSKGFRVTFALSPLIPAVGRVFTDFRWSGALLKDKTGAPMIVSNAAGYFAIIDLSNPEFVVSSWFNTYKKIKADTGFDGYVFDSDDIVPLLGDKREAFLKRWNALGDKKSDIYETLLDCDYPAVIDNKTSVAPLIKAQLMQPVSVVPAVAMLAMMSNKEQWQGIMAAVRFKTEIESYVKELLGAVASTGEPIARPMEYMFPNDGFADCTTQYLIGARYIVVPITGGSDKVTVRLPKGSWTGADGKRVRGPRAISVDVTEASVLYYELNK